MIVGVDIGTQSLKAVVTDTRLGVRGTGAVAYRPVFPRPGWAEQDPLLWERALGPAIAQALAAAGARAAQVRALGLAGQLDGCIACDAGDVPLAPCLIWMDRRAADAIAGIDAGEIRQRCGVVLDASHMAAKIRWLRGHLDTSPARFHQPVSWLLARLSGRRLMDHGVASTTMLYSLAAHDFDPALLALFEVDAGTLPALAPAASAAGALHASGSALTGLPAGIPVAVGSGDDFCTPLGGGLATPGRAACVLGTAEVVGALHGQPVVDKAALVETHAWIGDGWFIENPGWYSGGAVAWLRELLGFEDDAALDAAAERAPPGAGGLTFLPAMNGAMAPEWNAAARGCFYGLTPAHGRAHLARAVLEGCAFAMRDVVERLRALDVAVGALLHLGGGARSRTWARIRADLTGLPVQLPVHTDTSPLGAAMLAAVAAGIATGLDACTAAAGVAATIEPEPARRAAMDEAHRRYLRLYESLRPMFVQPGGR